MILPQLVDKSLLLGSTDRKVDVPYSLSMFGLEGAPVRNEIMLASRSPDINLTSAPCLFLQGTSTKETYSEDSVMLFCF